MTHIAKGSDPIALMFDRVAWRYDVANRVLSAGSDVAWRQAVVAAVVEGCPRRVLDVCSGTGDQSLAILKRRDFIGRVVCADISWEMLRRGSQKQTRAGMGDRAMPILADVHRMGFSDGIFDCATVCFGVRNFNDIGEGLSEIARVLQPGGKLIILEFTRPQNRLLGSLYHWYLHKALPAIGGAITGQGQAYRYLANSIQGFLSPEELAGRLESAGFTDVKHRLLSAGIVTITTAKKKLATLPLDGN